MQKVIKTFTSELLILKEFIDVTLKEFIDVSLVEL